MIVNQLLHVFPKACVQTELKQSKIKELKVVIKHFYTFFTLKVSKLIS